MNSATIIGFVGADPEQRQARNNGSKFTVLSVATQRSWKNGEDEWASKVEWHRIVIFRPRLAESVLNTIKKGAHVLVEGELVSSAYERPNSKSKKSATKITSWSIRADVVRKLDRGEPQPEAIALPRPIRGKLPNLPRKFITNFCATSALRHRRRALLYVWDSVRRFSGIDLQEGSSAKLNGGLASRRRNNRQVQVKKVGLGFDLPPSLFGLRGLQNAGSDRKKEAA